MREMQDLDDFLKEREPAKTGKQSILMPYFAEILGLKTRGYSERVILDFLLEKKKITISQQSLNRFIRKQMAKNNASIFELTPASNQVNSQAENEKIDTNQSDIKQQAKSDEPMRSAASHTERPGIRRWPTADEVDLSKLYWVALKTRKSKQS